MRIQPGGKILEWWDDVTAMYSDIGGATLQRPRIN